MDRAGWDEDRGFEGGIFSGNGSVSRDRTGAMPYQRVQNVRRIQHESVRPDRCCGCYGQCARIQRKEQTVLMIMAVAAMVALLLAFLATLLCLVFIVTDRSESDKDRAGVIYQEVVPQTPMVPLNPEIPYTPEIPYVPDVPYSQEIPEEVMPMNPFEDFSGKTQGNGSSEESQYYGELQDAIRTDLPYSIKWENYEYAGNSDTVMIAVDYPVIQGGVPNRELLNQKIAEETEYFEEYYTEYSRYMLPDEIFAVYSEGFVTYMDEKVLSVVFCETIYTDYWVDCGLYCINIDVENGIVMDNSSILQVDDSFAIDFRMRSREQNGTIGELEYLSDQEIAHYLSNTGTAILFYTPLGMEVGLNYGESYVTVTYKDYEQYLQKY